MLAWSVKPDKIDTIIGLTLPIPISYSQRGLISPRHLSEVKLPVVFRDEVLEPCENVIIGQFFCGHYRLSKCAQFRIDHIILLATRQIYRTLPLTHWAFS